MEKGLLAKMVGNCFGKWLEMLWGNALGNALEMVGNGWKYGWKWLENGWQMVGKMLWLEKHFALDQHNIMR